MLLPNDQMKSGRYLRWHAARKRIAWIIEQLNAGRIVQIATYTRATRYSVKHQGMFRATKTGAFVQRGKNWDCIDGCDLRSFSD